MLKFREYSNTYLEEALITFGGRLYPNYGQIVFLVGSAGSGLKTKLRTLGINGKWLDTADLKELVVNANKIKKENNTTKKKISILGLFRAKPKEEINKYIKLLNVETEKKPNLIFDVTLKELRKLRSLLKDAETIGYLKTNIHLIWNMKDLTPVYDLKTHKFNITTHENTIITLERLLKHNDLTKRYLDGDIWLMYDSLNDKYMQDNNFVQIKKKYRERRSVEEIGTSIIKRELND